jgi:hypothetical protein
MPRRGIGSTSAQGLSTSYCESAASLEKGDWAGPGDAIKEKTTMVDKSKHMRMISSSFSAVYSESYSQILPQRTSAINMEDKITGRHSRKSTLPLFVHQAAFGST